VHCEVRYCILCNAFLVVLLVYVQSSISILYSTIIPIDCTLIRNEPLRWEVKLLGLLFKRTEEMSPVNASFGNVELMLRILHDIMHISHSFTSPVLPVHVRLHKYISDVLSFQALSFSESLSITWWKLV
jgi:hypothetical protein